MTLNSCATIWCGAMMCLVADLYGSFAETWDSFAEMYGHFAGIYGSFVHVGRAIE